MKLCVDYAKEEKKLRKAKKHDGKKTRERGGEYAAGLGEGRTGV